MRQFLLTTIMASIPLTAGCGTPAVEDNASKASANINLESGACVPKSILVDLRPIWVMPTLYAGDTEFGGWGPWVYSDVRLSFNPLSVNAAVYMSAIETGSPDTKAQGSAHKSVYDVNYGWQITGIHGPLMRWINYTDTNHDDDVFYPGYPVRQYISRGDRRGDDVGVYTSVEVHFEQVWIDVAPTPECSDW